jgi:hypothetical protein
MHRFQKCLQGVVSENTKVPWQEGSVVPPLLECIVSKSVFRGLFQKTYSWKVPWHEGSVEHRSNKDAENQRVFLHHFALKTPKWQRYIHSFTPTKWAFWMRKGVKRFQKCLQGFRKHILETPWKEGTAVEKNALNAHGIPQWTTKRTFLARRVLAFCRFALGWWAASAFGMLGSKFINFARILIDSIRKLDTYLKIAVLAVGNAITWRMITFMSSFLTDFCKFSDIALFPESKILTYINDTNNIIETWYT